VIDYPALIQVHPLLPRLPEDSRGCYSHRMDDERRGWLALGRAMLPPRRAAGLLQQAGGTAELFTSAPQALSLRPTERERLQEAWARAPEDAALLEKCAATLLTMRDPAYPPLLREIYDPPVLLYVRGEITPADRRAVAIVGSRRSTPYGRMVAQSLARGLAEAGVTVVSGMALGIDAAAHRGALEAGGRTIAVLGCGVDRCYPAEHRGLMQQIVAAGAVASELPPGMPPVARHFPQRNRIISGLTLGTVVVEAPEKSGALITAGLALEQGREVFAVPGSVNSEQARGAHRLLKEGAKLAESIADILEELDLQGGAPRTPPVAARAAHADPESPADPLLAHLSLEPVGLEQLQEQTGLPAGELSARVLLLELKGLVGRLPGNRLVRLA